MTLDTRDPARPPSRLARAAAVVLELLPLLLVGLGAGLVYLPAGFLVPGLLWWWSDLREAAAAARPPPAPMPPPRGPRGSEP